MAQDDYALLVGISTYPLTDYLPLAGPPNDIELVRKWLASPQGGAVPSNQILIQTSPFPAAPAPSAAQIWGDLERVVFENGEVKYRPQARLYLHFSGHGFSSFLKDEANAAVYAGDARQRLSYNVCGTAMALWCKRAGVFGEIVLVMDCCRDREVSKQADEPHFNPIDDPTRAKDVRVFEVYAVPYGDKAQERPISQLDNKTYGLLTYAWVEALKKAPGADGVRTAHDIKQYIEGIWGTLVGDERIEQPEFVIRGRGNIEFPKPPTVPVTASIRLSTLLQEAAQVTILDGGGVPVYQVDLIATQQTHTNLVSGAQAAPAPFDGGTITVALDEAVYEVIIHRDGKADVSTLWMLLGGKDVELII